jgi:hypothetical protein
LDRIEITESDFALLAAEHAHRVKPLLQAGRVEPERVFLA